MQLAILAAGLVMDSQWQVLQPLETRQPCITLELFDVVTAMVGIEWAHMTGGEVVSVPEAQVVPWAATVDSVPFEWAACLLQVVAYRQAPGQHTYHLATRRQSPLVPVVAGLIQGAVDGMMVQAGADRPWVQKKQYKAAA